MEKSRLGISIGLFGAILYFIGAGAPGSSVFILAFATGYIMLFEQNEWLKKTALKALILSIFFAVLFFVLNHLTTIIVVIINSIVNIRAFNNVFNIVATLPHILPQSIRIIEILLFVVLGFRAYNQKDVKINIIDKVINREEE